MKHNVVKPFVNLTVVRVCKSHCGLGLGFVNLTVGKHARGCIDVDIPKPELYSKLKKLLEGCQWVHLLLLSNLNCELELLSRLCLYDNDGS